MKRLTYLLLSASFMLILTSCGGEKNSTEAEGSGDVFRDQITALFADFEAGLKPLSNISEISKFDANQEAYVLPGGKATGNFKSEWEKGDYSGSRFYSKRYDDDSKLGDIRLSVTMKEDAYYNDETGEEDASKKIDLNTYVKMLSDKLGVEAKDVSNTLGGYQWVTATEKWGLDSYDDYSLQVTVKAAR